MNKIYSTVKQLALILAGALLGVIPALYFTGSAILQDSKLVIGVTLGLLLLGFGVTDVVPFIWHTIVSHYNNMRKNIGILCPYEVKDKINSSWVTLSIDEITSYISGNSGYGVKKILRIPDYISHKVIFNPYGGVYPEDNVADLLSFTKILKYVKNGGIFVNIADIPFYYAYDSLLQRMVDTTPLTSGVLNYDLRNFYNTLVADIIKCLIVGTNPIPKENSSDIARVAKVEHKTVNLFDKTYPLFTGNGEVLNASPVVKIPYGRGYFIFSTIELKRENRTVLDYVLKGISDIF